ncbi:hypothetical protein CALCODRAFT_557534 [Calocera cornea HHB12733]|uniref:Amidoligase enzyme n=1 Tax=Calocera cornea HHB12733 TaxID=1353952 RepID=A0A165DSI4_9BASI|nr:hypothetical protein CALCODRAFT_557534 [Calocera cornea HHB12733]
MDEGGMHLFGPSSEREWKTAITDILSALNNHIMLWTNRTTGLHVHVAPGISQPWSPADLRKIALLFVLLEDQVDLYHAAHRWKPNPRNERFIASMRKSRFCAGMTKLQLGESILQMRSWEELAALVNPNPDGGTRTPYSRYYKVNFTAIGKHGTVEFRQHEGTLDLQQIFTWAETVLALVRLAMGTEERALLQLCLSNVQIFDVLAMAN